MLAQPAHDDAVAVFGAFRSLLVPVDLSPLSDRVAARAAHLPLAKGARLTLLHVVPPGLSHRDEARAKTDARKALEGEAKHLARALPEGVSVEPLVTVASPAREIAERALSLKADLIVMGRGGGRPVRDAFLGSTAERVIRRGQLPVLVVRKTARGAYRRPCLALDFDDAAHSALEVLLRVLPPPRPEVSVVHAYDAPYQGLMYPSLSERQAEEYREHSRDKALEQLERFLARALTLAQVPPKDAPRFRPHLRYGAARTVIEAVVRSAEADLLALGTHAYSGVAHVLLGTVAGDVLRDVSCDVLVVPPWRAPAEGR